LDFKSKYDSKEIENNGDADSTRDRKYYNTNKPIHIDNDDLSAESKKFIRDNGRSISQRNASEIAAEEVRKQKDIYTTEQLALREAQRLSLLETSTNDNNVNKSTSIDKNENRPDISPSKSNTKSSATQYFETEEWKQFKTYGSEREALRAAELLSLGFLFNSDTSNCSIY
jgi:hypothetical protein